MKTNTSMISKALGEHSVPIRENLRQRAYLNSMASWVDTFTRMVVAFFLNPYIVSTLGSIFYGVWQILSQLNSYMAMADLQTSTTLKWVIAKDRTIASKIELRQSVTAALSANIIILPIYLIAGGIIVWLAPYVSSVEEQHFTIVRITSALLVLAFIITQVLFIFDQVLAAMNLSYKSIVIRFLSITLGGVLTACMLYFGYGLPGMSVALCTVSLVTGISIGWIVLANVSWFGFARVTWMQVISFIKLTGWFMALKIVSTANFAMDMILLGYLAGPRYVTVYTLSRYLMSAASSFCSSAFNAATPGLSRLMGEKDYAKLLTARGQLLSLLWVGLTSIGTVVCLWNKSFIGIWTSPEYFAGQIETCLIVLLFILKSIQAVDGSIIVMALEARKSTILGAISVSITIFFAWLLIPLYQTMGLLLSLLAGIISMCISYSYYASRLTQRKASFFISTYLSRTPVVCIILLAISGFMGNYVKVNSWSMLAGVMSATIIIVASILWFSAMSYDDRRNAIKNITSISFLNKAEIS